MFILALLAIIPTVLFVYAVCEISRDFEGMEKNGHEEKPINDCSSEDYEFFNEHVNNGLRNN